MKLPRRLPAEQAVSLSGYDYAGYLGIPLFHQGGRIATRNLLKMCGVRSANRVLDVGCGTGYTLRQIVKRSKTVAYGIDTSPLMLETTRRRCAALIANDRVIVRNGSALEIPYSNRFFDVVISEATLMHVERKATSYFTLKLHIGLMPRPKRNILKLDPLIRPYLILKLLDLLEFKISKTCC